MTSPDDESIERLSALVGIEPEYYDNWGIKHEAGKETKAALLKAMGFDDPASALSEFSKRPWNRFIEPVMVVSENRQPDAIPIYFPLPEGMENDVTIAWNIRNESGKEETREFKGVRPADSATLEGKRYIRVDLPNEIKRGLGYFELKASCVTQEGEYRGRMRLIITPDRCYVPDGRTWGLSVNLYALRSENNWGTGDLGDLMELALGINRKLGGGFVGINPLHAIPNRMPFGISPYSSTSRLYRNFLYIDVAGLLRNLPGGTALLDDPSLIDEIQGFKTKELIDYEGIAALKKRALKSAFVLFCEAHIEKGTREARDFEIYIENEGGALLDFATFCAIEEYLRAENPGLYRWQDWPEKFRSPKAPEVEEFRDSNREDVLFYQYLQWVMDRQLRDARKASSGMKIGIYQDLAVGSSGEGSDAWSYPEAFAFGATAGAPPDAFNPNGQDWGFPPFVPHRLRESGYELFIETIRKNLMYSGALRIDHALGLFRLFFIPEGMSPREGTYVRYPSEEMLRIIALESKRNSAVIIAEDLGTIGEAVREALLGFGMLSYRLFYFERNWETFDFLQPEAYPEMAFTAVTTHDLPTIYGYWTGRDIEVKKGLGLYPDDETISRDTEERKRDRDLMMEALQDFLPDTFQAGPEPPPEMSEDLCFSVYRFLARTPCKLVSVSLDDVLGTINQQNMPGTIDSHPNWRQKTPLEPSNIIRHQLLKRIADIFREESRGGTHG